MTSRKGFKQRHHVPKSSDDDEILPDDDPQPDWDMLPDAPFNGTGKLLTRKPRRRRRDDVALSRSGKDVNPFDVEELGSMVAYEVPGPASKEKVAHADEKNV